MAGIGVQTANLFVLSMTGIYGINLRKPYRMIIITIYVYIFMTINNFIFWPRDQMYKGIAIQLDQSRALLMVNLIQQSRN